MVRMWFIHKFNYTDRLNTFFHFQSEERLLKWSFENKWISLGTDSAAEWPDCCRIDWAAHGQSHNTHLTSTMHACDKLSNTPRIREAPRVLTMVWPNGTRANRRALALSARASGTPTAFRERFLKRTWVAGWCRRGHRPIWSRGRVQLSNDRRLTRLPRCDHRPASDKVCRGEATRRQRQRSVATANNYLVTKTCV